MPARRANPAWPGNFMLTTEDGEDTEESVELSASNFCVLWVLCGEESGLFGRFGLTLGFFQGTLKLAEDQRAGSHLALLDAAKSGDHLSIFRNSSLSPMK